MGSVLPNRRVWRFRIYADDTVVHEDDWAEYEYGHPYVDDYCVVSVPIQIIEYLQDD